MSEEMNDGSWGGLKKTIVGTLGTVVAGGGTWLGVTLFGGHEEEPKEETKTEQAAPAPVVVNVQQNQENKQQVKQGGGTNTVIKERVIEKPAAAPAKAEPAKEEEPW